MAFIGRADATRSEPGAAAEAHGAGQAEGSGPPPILSFTKPSAN